MHGKSLKRLGDSSVRKSALDAYGTRSGFLRGSASAAARAAPVERHRQAQNTINLKEVLLLAWPWLSLTGQEGGVDNLSLMVGCEFQRRVRAGRSVAFAALVVGCTQILGCAQTIHNDPVNAQLTGGPRHFPTACCKALTKRASTMVAAPCRSWTSSTSSPASPVARCWPPITA